MTLLHVADDLSVRNASFISLDKTPMHYVKPALCYQLFYRLFRLLSLQKVPSAEKVNVTNRVLVLLV